jgi:hypothetical protein
VEVKDKKLENKNSHLELVMVEYWILDWDKKNRNIIEY